MEIHLNDLPAELVGVAADWQAFFDSPGWRLFLQRFEPRLEGTVSRLESADTLLELGTAKGVRTTLLEMVRLEEILESEFLEIVAAAQAERQDAEDSRWAMA